VQEVQQKLKLKTPQEAKALIQQYKQPQPATVVQPLNKPVSTKLAPAAASAAPSTTYSTQPAI
jgi:prolyl-tRNA editing enzyme YbaK/EbsC (Cys-tRNA(Pro) deacylase)